MRISLSLLVLLLLAAPPLRAQAPDTTACTYNTCALRVEPSFWGAGIVRGVEGERVARIGFLGTRPRLSQVVAGSEPAVEQARIYERQVPRGTLLLLAGTALLLVPDLTESRLSDEAQIVSTFGGVGLTLWGSATLADAQRALSRALWWYNGQLPR